jgi:hypothetical protein
LKQNTIRNPICQDEMKLSYLVFAISSLSIVVGVLFGEAEEIFRRAIIICLSCLGL